MTRDLQGERLDPEARCACLDEPLDSFDAARYRFFVVHAGIPPPPPD